MNTPNKIKIRHPDRVSLKPESLARLSKWIEDIQSRFKGVRVAKGDLVNFLINSHPTDLCEDELEQLGARYFDEVRFYSWAISRLKAERAEGKNSTLADIISSVQPSKREGGMDESSNSN